MWGRYVEAFYWIFTSTGHKYVRSMTRGSNFSSLTFILIHHQFIPE